MDDEKSFISDILDVFKENENLNDSSTREPECATKSGFLEDIINLEKDVLCGKKKSLKSSNCEQQPDASNDCPRETSVIHDGCTDSSDDEDRKYFEQNKYNECGRNIKNLLKSNTSSKPDSPNNSKNEDSWSKSISAKEKLKVELEKLSGVHSSSTTLLRDPILGMNIINPLVSSNALKEKLMGRVSISTSKMKKFLETPESKDSNWVTGGAVVNKLIRTSQKGNQYCVWHLTDLSGDIKTVSVFLFGSAYREHWKTSIGTVVGILNPFVMDNNDKSEATLRVDNAQKILVIGTSKDYGLCKSKKKNGENCTFVVNKSKCDYCMYHMKKEYDKACRRNDLQPPKIGRKIDNFRAKNQAQSQVCYGKKIFSGVIGKKSSSQLKKDEDRMKLLSLKPVSSTTSQKQRNESILKKLNQNPNEVPALNKDIQTLPKPECKMIDLGFTITKKERMLAKINALKYIREHGPLNKVVETEKAKRTPERISNIKRKLEADEKAEKKKVKTSIDTPPDPVKEKLVKNGITEEFMKLMNSETRNSDFLKVAEMEEREKYFEKLETREKIENKMATTFKVECKAVRCLKCNYKAFSASELCKKEKHPLKVVKAMKRFWKCGDCSARTTCLELVPLHSCKNCGSSKWEKTSMMPEKKHSNIIKAPLSVRGDEETFLGTATKQANLNLLVPEDAC